MRSPTRKRSLTIWNQMHISQMSCLTARRLALSRSTQVNNTLQAENMTLGLTSTYLLISLTFASPLAPNAFLAPATRPLSELTLPNLTNTSNSSPSPNPNIAVFCNSSTTWLAPGSTFNTIYPDCVQAAMDVLDVAGIYHSLHFEFLAADQTPRTQLHTMRTPRRYTFRE